MTWELAAALLSVAGCVCAILFGARNSRRADDKQLRDDTLDSANRGIEDMRVEVRTHGNQIAELGTRITRCEESCKSAHHRIDTIERGNNHEHEN